MKDLILYITRGITGEESITVDETEENEITIFTLHIPQDKIGMVIGKGGRTINSIKNIAKVIAIRENKRIALEIAEE